ncbi:Protein FAM227B [Trichoplax sp. H2]|nr:Protein FAM227B [Trichoplax sp. H2]|eukprot:RDD43769.1 Protein FAM227B [Trichoplax sp. H2]
MLNQSGDNTTSKEDAATADGNPPHGLNRTKKVRDQDPVKTLDEWMIRNKLTVWPKSRRGEDTLGINKEEVLNILGTPSEIKVGLASSAPLNTFLIDNVIQRLENIESRLNTYTSQIVTTKAPPRPDSIATWIISTSSCIQDLVSEDSHELKSLSQDKVSSIHQQAKGLNGSYLIRMRNIKFAVYPGFTDGELTPLPCQLEPLQILYRVTKLQHFKPEFEKEWKKYFMSDASIAMFLDIFWWFFLENVSPDGKIQDRIFTRISDSYVVLITKLADSIKDFFYKYFSNCLAQAAHAVFVTAYPESFKMFISEEFRSNLLNYVSEWIDGCHPPPRTWSKWHIDEPKNILTKLEKEKNLMKEGFKEVVAAIDLPTMENAAVDREKQIKSRILSNTTRTQSTRTIKELAKKGKLKPLSHVIGQGEEFHKVSFNAKGRSPLITHFLRKNNVVQEDTRTAIKLSRTQIAKLPYLFLPVMVDFFFSLDVIELLKFTKAKVLDDEYQRLCAETDDDIRNINIERKEMVKDISNQKNNILNQPGELKYLSDQLMDKKVGVIDSNIL